MSLSIGVDHSTVPPTLRINGHICWQWDINHYGKDARKEIRRKLSGMTNGAKLVAYTMKGAVLPTVNKSPLSPKQQMMKVIEERCPELFS